MSSGLEPSSFKLKRLLFRTNISLVGSVIVHIIMYAVVYRNSYKNIKKDLGLLHFFECGVGGGVIISPSLVRFKRIFTETISQAIFTFECFTFLYSVCRNQNKHWIFLTYCVCSNCLHFLNHLMENDQSVGFF